MSNAGSFSEAIVEFVAVRRQGRIIVLASESNYKVRMDKVKVVACIGVGAAGSRCKRYFGY